MSKWSEAFEALSAGSITALEREDRLTLRQQARLVRIAAETSNYEVRKHALRLLDEAAKSPLTGGL